MGTRWLLTRLDDPSCCCCLLSSTLQPATSSLLRTLFCAGDYSGTCSRQLINSINVVSMRVDGKYYCDRCTRRTAPTEARHALHLGGVRCFSPLASRWQNSSTSLKQRREGVIACQLALDISFATHLWMAMALVMDSQAWMMKLRLFCG